MVFPWVSKGLPYRHFVAYVCTTISIDRLDICLSRESVLSDRSFAPCPPGAFLTESRAVPAAVPAAKSDMHGVDFHDGIGPCQEWTQDSV